MSEGTVVRAFELPLHRIDPSEAWPVLRECWKHATKLANWCVLRLVKNEPMPVPGEERQKMPKINLYSEAGKVFGLTRPDHWWGGAAGSFSAVTKRVHGEYVRWRSLILRGDRSPALYDYPFPFPIRGQEWKSASFDKGRPYVVINLPSGQPRKAISTTLHLRGGSEFGRQLALFRQVVSGDLPRIELVIREQDCSRSCHRPILTEKTPGGGQDRTRRVMVKMVARLPVREKPGERFLSLDLDPEAFWVAELDGRRAWTLNADHVRRAQRWINAHEGMLGRLSQDTKAERRLRTGRLLQLNEAREKRVQRHRDRMASWLHESAAHLTGFAVRQKVGVVLYRDIDKGFVERFPWARLKGLLRDKLTAAGIDLRCASDGEGVTEEEVEYAS